ncbi:Blood vessel epicardial substance-like 1 [Homarus americanus]|uniref:Blood vessel epicardial substance-like 1 n=1 Tax=Homarus americanus TaxID=6706 RepID=A0A8J5N4Y6_HOMAM|nr:Blood vessel epicardial substance-like 1 [Homarus americanus]
MAEDWDYNLTDVDSFNVTEDDWQSTVNSTFLGSLFSCAHWTHPQHLLFQLANGCFFVSYLAPSQRMGLLFMHCILILGFLLYSTWAWNVICAPDVFSWNFTFMLLNMGQTLYIIYQMRPVKVNKELEAMYEALFQPLDFLDSPEFESSRASLEDKFKVSIIAATSCRYVFWQRTSLEYLFVKESYLATVLSTIIARDITTKLYNMNQKIVTEKGSHLDIRLPSLTSSLSSSCGGDGSLRSPARFSLRYVFPSSGMFFLRHVCCSLYRPSYWFYRHLQFSIHFSFQWVFIHLRLLQVDPPPSTSPSDRSPSTHASIRSGGGGGGLGGGHGGSGSSAGGVGCTGGLASSLAGVAGLGLGAKHARLGYTILPTSAPRYEGRERLDLAYRENRGAYRDNLAYRENGYVPNGRPEMTPLTELPSTDSLTDTSHDIHTWLEDSSRYTHR